MKNITTNFLLDLLSSTLGRKKQNTSAKTAATIALGLATAAGISYIVSVLVQSPKTEEDKENDNEREEDETPRTKNGRGAQSKTVQVDESLN